MTETRSALGRFDYDGEVRADFDDRMLFHLQNVMTSKLRRGEPFLFSWRNDTSVGGGRVSVWINPTSRLVFKYGRDRQVQVNRRWLEALMHAANSPGGLRVVPEPDDVAESSAEVAQA
jgi:hypothetical protein